MLDLYPLNLVLAVAVASATIFLGFLPARNLRHDFFARQVLWAGFGWIFICVGTGRQLWGYHPNISLDCLLAFVCFISWWYLRRERALGGKIWLCIASGVGISLGVMFLLKGTPMAYPYTHALSDNDRKLLIASIYLGGAVTGLAYVCFILTQGLSTETGITRMQVKRYVGLLGLVVLARGMVLFISYFIREPVPIGPDAIAGWAGPGFDIRHRLAPEDTLMSELLFALILVVIPVLTFVATRATRLGSSARAKFALIGICVSGLLAECIARLLVI